MESFTSPVNVLVEGITDEVVARRLLEHVGLRCGTVYGKEGKAALVRRLPNYNQAARFAPWLVVVDLDHDAECAPPFVHSILQRPADHMFLRVAVRAVEAWLLADGERIATFLGVRRALIPPNPDAEDDPKATLVNLARRSRWRTVREDMVPREGSGGRVGPGYSGRLIEFVVAGEGSWRPDVAARRSDSLRRCVEALRTLRESTFHSSRELP